MIILKDYFNNKIAEVTPAISLNGLDLLYKVNRLLADYVTKGNVLRVSPKTGCLISGNKDGDGGFRLQSSKLEVLTLPTNKGWLWISTTRRINWMTT